MLRDTGASVRIYNLANALASSGNNVELIFPKFTETCARTQRVTVRSLNGFLPKHFLRLISKFLGVSRPTSLLFYDIVFIQKASHIIRKSDIIQFEQQSAGALLIPIVAKIFKKPVVIDCHDTFQALRIKNTSFLRKIFETAIEKMVYNFASLILTVSEKEKNFLISLGINKDRINITPNGVDTSTFVKSIDTTKVRECYDLADNPVIVFVGNMEYLPNREAARLISLKIAPKVKTFVKNAKFLIVGRINGPIYPNSSFTGIVEDVVPILAASDVAIAPLLHGSGTRLKILEYLSCALPVVSTSIGVEGLNVVNEEHLLIEDDMDEFAIKVIKLLQDEELRKQLGNSGRELVVSRYDWQKIVKNLSDIYQKLLLKANANQKSGESASLQVFSLKGNL